MAFLDNSGDIILDAVLTDTGRFRLAKGDGSFRIVKFALADDEINYALYDKNNASGSAYYDLEILQTPVMEAFTNNTSTMNYRLLSIPRTNLLYLPIMKINNLQGNGAKPSFTNGNNDGFAVAVTDATWQNAKAGGTAGGTNTSAGGWMNGASPNATPDFDNVIRLDQGIDNSAVSWAYTIDQDLKETQYIIEIDSRLGIVCSPDGTHPDAAISFVDDDNIASYYISDVDGDGYVLDIKSSPTTELGYRTGTGVTSQDALIIAGAQGTSLRFRIKSTLELQSSNYLFDTLGNTLASGDESAWGLASAGTYSYIDTIVKVTGATTGYRLNIPVRFFKCTSGC